jgi:hypothetical protein
MKQFFAFTLGIAMMLMTLPLQAQDHTVSGTVVSAPDSQPLPGASVVETGTRNGTATDRDGSFSLEVDNPNASLTVMFVGFVSQTIEVEGRDEITITLEKDTALQEEMAVTAEGDTETVIVRERRVPRIRMDDSERTVRYKFTSKEEDSTVVVVNIEGDTTIVITKELQLPEIRIDGSSVGAQGYTVTSEEDSVFVIYPDGRTRYSISRRAPDFVERDVVVNTEGDSIVVIVRGERAMRARIPARMERGRKHVHHRTDRHHRRGQSRDSGRMERGRKRVRDRAGQHQWHDRRRNSSRVGRHHRVSEISREHEEALREMMVEVRRLAREVRQADEESHAEKMEALKAKVGEMFEEQQSIRAREMEERQENKEELIEELMDRLLGRNRPYSEISRERVEALRERMDEALRRLARAREELQADKEARAEEQRR